MTVQEFVRDSLTQILAGVAEAKAKDKRVAPWVNATELKAGSLTTVDGTVIFPVQFDIAVTVSESKGGGSGGISVAQVFSIEAARDATKEQSQVSRIQFSVPIRFANMQEMPNDVAKDAA